MIEKKPQYFITWQGLAFLASAIAGDTITITRVMVGKGKVPDGADPKDFTELVEPVAMATSTAPVVRNGSVSFIVEYRSDLNGGLETGFWISEVGIFARNSAGDEVLIHYYTLGDAIQYVSAYDNKQVIDIRRYPVVIKVTDGVNVVMEYPLNAFMTADEITDYFNETLLKLLMEEFKKLLREHNVAEDAHQDIRAEIAKLQSEIDQLKAALNTNITKNLFNDGYADLDAYETFEGVWNKPKQAEF